MDVHYLHLAITPKVIFIYDSACHADTYFQEQYAKCIALIS